MYQQRFTDRVAVVTGAAQGIGLASAATLGRQGARVALIDVNHGEVEAAAERLRGEGIDARAWVADVSEETQVAEAIDQVTEVLGAIDVLHAHAGVLLPAAAWDETVEQFDRTFAVNVRGIFVTVRAVLPGMRERRSGAIVLTGSTAGMVAEREFLGYCTSKAAVNHMARQLALDCAGKGVRVNAVCPGWIDTAFSDPILTGMSQQEVADAVRSVVPLGRQGTADEVAAAVAFLCSDEASYITGHALVVDGAMTIV